MGKRFSIVTPIYLGEDHEKERRLKLFPKCIESIKNQTYDKEKIQQIIINDGSTIPLKIPNYPWIKIIDQNNLQRLTAYNNGFEAAKGEYIWCLDSDDELLPQACETMDKHIESKYRLYNFGCIFRHSDGAETQRGPFKPKKKKKGHEVFGGGNIVNGTFIFHKSVFKDLGGFMPPAIEQIDTTEVAYPAHYGDPEPYIRDLFNTSPYDFSAYMQLKYPEIRQYFMTKHPDHPKGLQKELGNPYGNDFYLFYKYTRQYKCKAIKEHLLRVNLK